MSILEQIASKIIRSGGNAVEVEHKDGYEEIFPRSGPVGAGIGFRLRSSSREAKSLRADLYNIAKYLDALLLMVVNTISDARCTTVLVKTRFDCTGKPCGKKRADRQYFIARAGLSKKCGDIL
jgi:hypothetical protein